MVFGTVQPVMALLLIAIVARKLLKELFSDARSNLSNIPGPESRSWWKGHFGEAFHPDGWGFHEKIAKQFGSVIRLKSFMGETQLYTFDPKAMSHIFVKDQMIFEESSQFIEGNKLIFGEGLLSTLGEQHRKQRRMLNPVFSIAHLREMTPIFYEVAHRLEATLLCKLKQGPQEIDMLEWMARTAFEMIGQAGLGYSFDLLKEDTEMHKYSRTVKELVPIIFRMFFARNYLLPWAVKLGSPKFRRLLLNLFPWRDLHRARDMSDYMYALSTEIFESKKRALDKGSISLQTNEAGRGKDVISVLIKANLSAQTQDKLNEKELLGQMSTLIFAAMDTTSGAMSRILQLLSVHPDVQRMLRKEIRHAIGDRTELPYDELVALPYLDAVCRETLRLTRQDTVLPFSTPVRGLDGTLMKEVVIPNNTNVIVSILNSNRNPAVWGPDADEWKPERWLSPLPESVTDARIPGVYSHLMTFNAGGRSCIGFKFAQLEMKAVISLLVRHFDFSPSDKKIKWQMNSIASPAVEDGGPRPQMPLAVALLSKSS
ncbi:hypothetical protein VKT23_004994 [Stygiomarasmius scandens]|uniref:Cytochrome P450 n=1 Tax=Marasmiellus scandens TaxID=2682957 RepID=A0ABR1JSE6_9AGAR